LSSAPPRATVSDTPTLEFIAATFEQINLSEWR
jgi:hypothetical protein